jgi:flagellar motor switch protein FliG
MSDDGIQKAAILLLSLGEAEAAEILRHLNPREVQKLGAAMAGMKSVARDKIENVLSDFEKQALESTTLGVASEEYIRNVMMKALGDDKANQVIDRILHGGDTAGIEGLKWMDSASIAELVRNEHPQIIATIIVHLDRDQASEVLGLFTERLRNDTLLRIATLDGVQPAALKELNDVMSRLLSSSATTVKKTALGGVRTAAEILNYMSGAVEESVVGAIKEYDPDLAQKIIDQMFTFDNLLDLDDRAIQTVLREVQSESLILALKGASEDLRNKIFKNMSQRAADMLREDLESKGPVRVSEVEGQQKEILKIVRRLADEGQIAMGGKAEEAFV